MKASIIVIILTIVPLLTLAQETRPVDRYLEIAGQNNPKLKSLFNQYLAALEEVPQAGACPILSYRSPYSFSR